MKYIHDNEQGLTTFDGYFAYLESIRAQLPPHVFAFAKNPEHYDLRSRSSLHDAWVEFLEVYEASDGERQNRATGIRICLLGAYHDRRIHLEYKEVKSYSFSSENAARGHGDLLAHEVRVEGDNLCHEIAFERGTLLISCRDFTHREEPLASK